MTRQVAFVFCFLGLIFLVPPQARSADPPPIRKLTGKHLILFTDLPSSGAVDELPAVFDAAFPQWCEYFGIDAKAHADWQMTGCLMHDKARFQAAGLLPAEIPAFLNGLARGSRFWVNDQAADYYQRHLVLHEGTHSFMEMLVGGTGPPWYSEGMAELLATHRWADGQLTLRHMPAKAADAPKLGRVEIVQTDFAAGKALTLARVMSYDHRAHLQNEPYGWCWAATAFLDGHPKYRERFRKLPALAGRADFNTQFGRLFADDARELNEAWQAFVADIDYGYDFARTGIDLRAGAAPKMRETKLSVAADRGWQNTGVLVEAGKTYTLTASGMVQLSDQPKPWPSTPAGVSIRYRQGKPLGRLLAAVRSGEATGASGLVRPIDIANSATLTPAITGTLYLRVNEFPGELADNSGTYTVLLKSP